MMFRSENTSGVGIDFEWIFVFGEKGFAIESF